MAAACDQLKTTLSVTYHVLYGFKMSKTYKTEQAIPINLDINL